MREVRPSPENPLVVALDRPRLEEAEELAEALAESVGLLKVGLELFSASGPEAVRRIRRYAPVFVDLKLHDIPNTVEGAARNLARIGAALFTVHSLGGQEMVAAAVRGAADGAADSGNPVPLVAAVTVLSSLSGESLASPESLAFEATAAGATAVVVSGEDVRTVRDVVGEDVCLLVPGIRPSGGNGDDQVRVLTPREALEAGADYIVVGRPVIDAADPVGAARSILGALR